VECAWNLSMIQAVRSAVLRQTQRILDANCARCLFVVKVEGLARPRVRCWTRQKCHGRRWSDGSYQGKKRLLVGHRCSGWR